MMDAGGDYFSNHARRTRFPWSLYHGELDRRIARAVTTLGRPGRAPRVLLVGCGMETHLPGAEDVDLLACDLDARAIDACRRAAPARADRFAVCASPMDLPREGAFAEPYDAVVAKEVVEHTTDPAAWARVLADRVRVGGELVLTTPNYGRYSTLPLLESTVLEWVARRDGFSRRHIHPSRFDAARLARLDLGTSMRLVEVARTRTGWALVGRWQRT